MIPAEARKPLSTLEVSVGPLRVLVVDDEALIRRLVATTLTLAGHQVVEAADGQQAWEQFQAQLFHLVVTDIRMPGLDGLELLERIRAESPTTEVVMVTGFGDTDMVIRALRTGAANFVEKPFTAEEFIDQVAPTFIRCGLRVEAALLEEELEAERSRRELGRRLATLGRLLSGLAHEVHNPLTFVKGNIELLQRLLHTAQPKSAPSPPVGQMQALLDDLAYGVDRIEGLMDTMRRLGTNRLSDQADVPLATVLENSVRLAAARKPDQVVLHTELPGDEVVIEANAIEMESCFVNLLVNAYEALAVSGSKVDVLVRLFPYDTGGMVGFAEVTVRDDGPGIPAGIIEEVFTPFFTLKEDGTGLGLGIAYEAAKRNGAQLVIESEQGEGATVLVRVPYALAEPAPPREGSDR